KAARNRLAQAQANLQTADAQALQAKLAFDRAQRLREAEAVTVQEWESARANADATKAMRDQASDAVAEAETALDWYTLRAPFAGEVLRRDVDPGDLASPGLPLLQVYQKDHLRFAVAVPEGLVAQLEVGQALDLTFPKGSIVAKLTRILPSADPRTGTVTLHLSLAPNADLLPGVLGRLQVAVGERKTLVLPVAAVSHVGQIERVQVVREGHLVPVTIRSGKRHNGLIEILSGLTDGEEVWIP
ncbi:MAG: efflux RND transporter periplasmic adaptor subunit, partial [Planctomycetes bacterium]|nr:efflux RND transporter periplasmic adaptor subunit [Planctomycetota bacterium]